MTKILLVEDDKSLREIYGVRLLAEGYQIVSAGDGEEALAMAVKEHPDLIISDVMMPKISGFDMLDILRSTPETKDVKVIMMTALSSEDQRSRGEALGANRYLVKSQVGIEDVVRTVHDVLADSPIPKNPITNNFGVPAFTARQIPQPIAKPVDMHAPTSETPILDQVMQPQIKMAAPTPVEPQPVAFEAPTVTAPITPTQLPQPTAPFTSPAPASLGNQNFSTPEPQIESAQDIASLIDRELNGTPQAPQPPLQ